jgi:vacuolar protein sorting-associated protein 35
LQKPQVVKQIIAILTTPLQTYKNILTVLKLENYGSVMAYLTYQARKRVSVDIAKNAVENETRISSPEQVERLFEFISPLVKDEDDGPSASEVDDEDIEEDQCLVAGLVHLFSNAELEQLFAVCFKPAPRVVVVVVVVVDVVVDVGGGKQLVC